MILYNKFIWYLVSYEIYKFYKDYDILILKYFKSFRHAPGVIKAIQDSSIESSQWKESENDKYLSSYPSTKSRPERLKVADLPKDTSITVLKPNHSDTKQGAKLAINMMKKSLENAQRQTEKYEDDKLRIQVSNKYEINNIYK